MGGGGKAEPKFDMGAALETAIPDAAMGFLTGGPIGAGLGFFGGGVSGGLTGHESLFTGKSATPADYSPSLATSGGEGKAGSVAEASAIAKLLRGL